MSCLIRTMISTLKGEGWGFRSLSCSVSGNVGNGEVGSVATMKAKREVFFL